MRATFLIGEIGSWAEFYTGNILLVKKNRQSLFLVLKETWMCFNHHHLNISTPTPHITCIFKIDPPKSKPRALSWDVINDRPPTARYQLSVTSTSWKRRKKSRKCEGEMRRHVFCEVTQRFGDKHSRTCRRLIQFNINCLKHSFYSTGPLLLLSVCFFQDERYSLKERWNGPPIAIRYNRSYRATVWWKDCYVTPAASAREVTRSHLQFWSWLVVVGTFVLGLFWRNMPQFYWVYYFWSQA